mmetsp:Transcript_150829/g.420402  ORF Transcript_150829/g.420402 Transcript_150829/m.420402 type:complete len:161 (+) Transcript_150829:49-531(+)|eukprot:CAMPEP_0179101070 /NCGR_PEP_ID=MMETSP0796-20121207/46711_1 /TAXON_ID=73915 /ORGANISM="Pyrodinium bahamense, Strain pbaha01" /LENGTH=160 /DNA_ID=CAMNT_0020798911 /DNA_START=49 /DNA_END=531 /DNA_ORIENTATION=-
MMLGLRTVRPAMWMARSALQPSAIRWFAQDKQDVSSVRKGMILLYQNQYVEVKEWQPSKSGRAAPTYTINYEELDSGKNTTQKFSANTKMVRVEPNKLECQVMYLTGGGAEERRVVLADEDFNELELPLSRFYMNPNVSEGQKVVLYKDDDAIVKIAVLR